MRNLPAILLTLPLLAACDKESSVNTSTRAQSGIGAQCTERNDPGCGPAAVCLFGYCRSGCTTDAECPQGTLCIGDVPPFGCQLPADSVCNDTDRKCAPPLVCAWEKTCRMPCKVSKDCPRNDQECRGGVCVGDAEKGDAAKLYRSCSEGATRCGSDGAFCAGPSCEVHACNKVAPGWAAVGQCTGDAAMCDQGKCLYNVANVVMVTNPKGGTYGIDQTEVTRAQYARFVQDKGDDMSGQLPECSGNATYLPQSEWPPLDRLEYPVGYVDWCDAYAYCKWAGKRLCGKIWGGPNEFADFKDPTRSQWYNACTSAGANDYPYGDAYDPQACNGLDRFVGELLPAGASPGCSSHVAGFTGVLDLSGNKFEWEDSCDGATGEHDQCRLRGGAFSSDPANLSCDVDRTKSRWDIYLDAAVGFRCCWP